MGALGFVGTTFSDADFTVVGIIFGTLCRFIGQGGMLAIIAVLFVIPIIYNYTIGRKAA
jgi:PTS system ascorbate-specific IIC component